MQKNTHDELFYQQMQKFTDVDFNTLVHCGIKLTINQRTNPMARAIKINQTTINSAVETILRHSNPEQRVYYAVKYILALYRDLANIYNISNVATASEKILEIIRIKLWMADMDQAVDVPEILERVCKDMMNKVADFMTNLASKSGINSR